MRRGSKAWWSVSQGLLKKAIKTSSIPALKTDSGWVFNSAAKANEFANTFSAKFFLPDPVENEFTDPPADAISQQSFLRPLRRRDAEKILKLLSADSGSGPDGLSTRILRECASSLAYPFVLLCRIILASGRWPASWITHWIFPLYKKKSVNDASNYRGIHLTPQLSKAAERLIGSLFLPFLHFSCAFGASQFAYTPGRGARDALLYYVLSWICAINFGKKVAIYCSDVSGFRSCEI